MVYGIVAMIFYAILYEYAANSGVKVIDAVIMCQLHTTSQNLDQQRTGW